MERMYSVPHNNNLEKQHLIGVLFQMCRIEWVINRSYTNFIDYRKSFIII